MTKCDIQYTHMLAPNTRFDEAGATVTEARCQTHDFVLGQSHAVNRCPVGVIEDATYHAIQAIQHQQNAGVEVDELLSVLGHIESILYDMDVVDKCSRELAVLSAHMKNLEKERGTKR